MIDAAEQSQRLADGVTAAELERDGRLPDAGHRHRTVATTQRGRDRTAPHRRDLYHAVPVARQSDLQPLTCDHQRLTAGTAESPLRGDTHGGFGDQTGPASR